MQSDDERGSQEAAPGETAESGDSGGAGATLVELAGRRRAVPEELTVGICRGGRGAFVFSDLRLTNGSSDTSREVTRTVARAIDECRGPGAIVFAGDVFDLRTGADIESALLAHPRLQNGNTDLSTYGAKNYLLGLRYLTAKDTTYIFEYYRNGTGFSPKEMRDYFSFVDTSYAKYVTTGNPAQMSKPSTLFQGNYGKPNPEMNYLYLRVSQKEPFDILYFTPAITWIANVDDKSFSLAPELLYTGFTNWELRLRSIFIVGPKGSEFGEKQNDYRVDFRMRYYF